MAVLNREIDFIKAVLLLCEHFLQNFASILGKTNPEITFLSLKRKTTADILQFCPKDVLFWPLVCS